MPALLHRALQACGSRGGTCRKDASVSSTTANTNTRSILPAWSGPFHHTERTLSTPFRPGGEAGSTTREHDRRRPGTRDRPGPASEPRRGGIRARGDDALSAGDRGGHRVHQPERGRLLPREPRPHLPRRSSRSTRRASRSTRSRSSTSSTEPASSTRPAAQERVHELATLVPGGVERARTTRGIVSEMATLRGLIRAGNDIARLGFDRPGETVELVDRAEQIVFDLSQQRVSSEFAHIDELLKDSFETITKLYEAGSDITGTPSGFRDLDRLTSGLPAGQPDHRRGAPVDGEVGARALHGANVAVRHEHPGRAVHARDVEGRGDAAADVRRGQGRVAAPAHRQARGRRLAAAHGGVRQAREGADLRRRHRLDHDDGDPLEAAPAEVARAEPRPRDRRLPAADDERHDRPRTACRRSRRSRAR